MMMPKKKKKILIISSIISIIVIIIGVLLCLYYMTDMFKSNDILFYKYLTKSFEIANDFEKLQFSNEEYSLLENNKYISDIEGTINYTGEGSENNVINDLKININSQIDKANQYDYKKISLNKNDERLFETEYANIGTLTAIRPYGIEQFASYSEEMLNENDNLSTLKELKNINLNEIISFTEEEKAALINTYSGIIYQNIPISSYGKQKNVVITINEMNYNTNAYFVKITKEQFNNVYISLLEQLKNDEIILNKIINANKIINQQITEEEIKDEWTQRIESIIQKIKSSNIGEEERVIAIYECKGKTLRIEIQTDEYISTIDGIASLNDAVIELNIIEPTEKENSKKIRLQKIVQDKEIQYSLLLKNVEEDIDTNIELKTRRKIDETNKIENLGELKIYNEGNELIASLAEKISIVNEFEETIELNESNNVELEKLNEEQLNNAMKAIQENISEQIIKAQETINQINIENILINLNLMERKQDTIHNIDNPTEAERNRFNSQFEFCVGEGIDKEKIKRLIEISKSNLDSVKIMEYKEKEREDELPKPKKYRLIIKQNSANEELAQSLTNYIEESEEEKFTVEIEYNQENGLVENIFITIEE